MGNAVCHVLGVKKTGGHVVSAPEELSVSRKHPAWLARKMVARIDMDTGTTENRFHSSGYMNRIKSSG
jgi:hypothetical protein